jgi:ABC-type sugar transport system, periplasmic component
MIVFILCIVIIASFAFISCKAATTEITTAGETTKTIETTSAASEATTATTTGEVVTIKQNYWSPEEGPKWEAIYKEFNKKYPNIKMVFDGVTTDVYFNNLETNWEGGQADPLVTLWQDKVWNNKMFERKFIIDLTDLVPETSKYNELWMANLKTNDGKVFGAPYAISYIGNLYNKKIFRENNLEVPKTWSQFFDVCDKLKKAGITPLGFELKDTWMVQYIFDYFYKSKLGGQSFIDEIKAGTYNFNNPLFIEALKELKSLSVYFPDSFSGLGYIDQQSLMSNEKIAIWPAAGSWEVATAENTNPNIELGVFGVPVDKIGDIPYETVFQDQALAISSSASSEEVKAATTFINWLLAPENVGQINNTYGYFDPANINDFKDETLKEYATLTGPNNSYMINDWTILLSSGTPTGLELMQAGIIDLLLGKKSAEEVAKDIQDGLSGWYGKN